MALDMNVRGSTSGNGAEVDTDNNLKVNLPTNALKAGISQMGYVRDATLARITRITEEGEQYAASSRLLFQTSFNNAAAGLAPNTQFDTTATTMTLGTSGGFLRFNASTITTTATGVTINSRRTFTIDDGNVLRFKFDVRHVYGSLANKQCDLGIGYAAPAAGQSSATNEFIGFRWTTAGALIGVLEYSTGGASSPLTVNINGGVPYSDNVSREYEFVLTDNSVEFYVDRVYQASINRPNDGPGMLKAGSYPIFARLFIPAGTAPSFAPQFDLGDIAVIKLGNEADVPFAYRQAMMGRGALYNQAGLVTTNGTPANIPASATAPTAATGSNTAAVQANLGGWYQMNAASIIATAHVNVIVVGYQNPIMPTAVGAGNDTRNLVITDIMIPPPVVQTAVTGGGCVVQWFVTVGASAISLATTDAAGTTAAGTKAPKMLCLPIVDTLAAAGTVGAVAVRVGESSASLTTPLVVHPGEFITVGFRILQVTAAGTAGTYTGGIGINGYWD